MKISLICCYNSFRTHWRKKWNLRDTSHVWSLVFKGQSETIRFPAESYEDSPILWGIICIFRAGKMLYLCFSLWMWHAPLMLAPAEMALLNWWKKLYVDFVLYQGRLIKVVSNYYAMINLIHLFTKMYLFTIYCFLLACVPLC